MKKLSAVFLALVIIISSFSAVNVFAADEIKVSINDKLQTYDQMPVIIEGRTLVPMRAIFESLGASVEWANETKMVTGTKGDTVVKIQIGKTTAIVNGKGQKLDVPAQIVNDRTMVPARFVAEALGCEVGWDADTKTVLIKFEGTVNETKTEEPKKEESSSTEITYPCVLLSEANMSNLGINPEAGTAEFKDGILTADVTKTPEKQTDLNVNFKDRLDGKLKDGDVCLIKFKARLISGGKDGKGIVKLQVQNPSKSSEKSLFQEATFGTDWTEVLVPFAAKESTTAVGIRCAMTVQKIEIDEFEFINYGNTKTVDELKSGDITPVAPSVTPSTGSAEGTPVLSSVNMKDMVYVAKAGTVTSKEGLIEANVTSETTTQTDVYAYFKKTLNGRAKTGDVCLLTFKARLLSGGKDGKGIAKVQIQGDKTNNYKKTIFEEVTFGNDWTEISLPFTHEEGCNTVGIRFALAIQKLEIKDVSLVNYGTTKKVGELTKKVN